MLCLCGAGSGDQTDQPILVAVDHRVGLGPRQLARGRTVLGFLGQDAHAPLRQVLDQPGVMHVQTVSGTFFARPTMPGETCGLALDRGHAFDDAGGNREAEGFEEEETSGIWNDLRKILPTPYPNREMKD